MSTVTYSLEEILGQINQKLDNLQKDVTDIKIGQTKLEGDIKVLDERVSGIDKRLDEFNNRFNIMTVGFLSIIGVLVTGVLRTIAKLVFFPNP